MYALAAGIVENAQEMSPTGSVVGDDAQEIDVLPGPDYTILEWRRSRRPITLLAKVY